MLWTFAGVAAHCGVQILLHRRRRTLYLNDLKAVTAQEAGVCYAFLIAWLSVQVGLFGDWGGDSLVQCWGLSLDFRSVLGCLTVFTMSCVLFSGTFLQAVITDDFQAYLKSLAFRPALSRSVQSELLLRIGSVSLLRASGVGRTLTTLLVTIWSGLTALHWCYYFTRIRRSWSRTFAETVIEEAVEEVFVGFIGTRIYMVTGRAYPSLLLHCFVSVLHVPDCYFLHQNHPAHRYRRLLCAFYLVGGALFFLLHLSLLDTAVYASPY